MKAHWCSQARKKRCVLTAQVEVSHPDNFAMLWLAHLNKRLLVILCSYACMNLCVSLNILLVTVGTLVTSRD